MRHQMSSSMILSIRSAWLGSTLRQLETLVLRGLLKTLFATVTVLPPHCDRHRSPLSADRSVVFDLFQTLLSTLF